MPYSNFWMETDRCGGCKAIEQREIYLHSPHQEKGCEMSAWNLPLGVSLKDVDPPEVDCPACDGTALCDECLGDGKRGFTDDTACKKCGGSGECRKCSGTGNVLKSEIED